MPQGKSLAADVQWIVIRLASVMTKDNIAFYTGVSARTIERILERYNHTGTIKFTDKRSNRPLGIGRHLSDENYRVRSLSFVISIAQLNFENSIFWGWWINHPIFIWMK